MLADKDREYHVERARAELDLAYRAQHDAVIQSHLRLSALHMERARDVARAGTSSRLIG